MDWQAEEPRRRLPAEVDTETDRLGWVQLYLLAKAAYIVVDRY